MTGVEVLGTPFSNFVRAVRMVLEEKGVAYTLNPCRPHTTEIDAIHPMGKIPCFKHGDFTLFESVAIARYVDSTFTGPRLFPAEPKAAALVDQWTSFVNSTLMSAFHTYLVAYVFPRTSDGKPDRAAINSVLPQAEAHLRLLDGRVGATGYLAGDSFSYADINAMTILAYLHDLPETGALMKELPSLATYYAAHAERASFKATIPPPR